MAPAIQKEHERKMKTAKILLSATVLSLLGAGSALADAGGPGPTNTQKTTAVSSSTQGQLITNSYTVLPVVASVIQQTLQARHLPQKSGAANDGPMALRGMAASADTGIPFQTWVNAGGGNSHNSLPGAGYDIDNYGGQAGLQAEIIPDLVVGISGSWQNNNGTLSGGFTSQNTTKGLSPYAGWQFDEHWNVYGSASFNQGQTKLGKASSAYSGKYQSSEWDFQGGVAGSYDVAMVRVAPVVSLLYMRTTAHSFVDSTGALVRGSTTALTRGSAGGSVSLPLGQFEPYIRAGFEHDFSVPTGAGPNGDNGGTTGAGFTLTLSDAVWASVDAGYNSIGRTDLSLWSASARLNIRF
jgi:hypothetical protein